MKPSYLGCVVALAAVVLAPAAPPPPDLLDRVGTYAEALKNHLAVAIADEDYVQHAGSLKRTIRSEMLFMWLSEEHFWVSIRNVLRVDGRAIPDSRRRIDRALNEPEGDAYPKLRAIQEEGARFNIGFVTRTTNTPTVVLQFLLAATRPRFDFAVVRREQIGHLPVWRISFAERGAPTIIAQNGDPVLSSGSIWVREEDGAITRTELHIAGERGLKVEVKVDFAPDAKLGAWVPKRMDERYDRPGAPATTCTARYSNYRRFETSARIVTSR